MAVPVSALDAPVLANRHDWDAIAERHAADSLGHVIIDGLLRDDACSALHETLLEHWGWRHKDWTSTHLRNPHVATLAAVSSIGHELAVALPSVLGGWVLIDAWGLLYPSAGRGRPHRDAGGRNLTLWLTPDEHNRSPGTGGLVLYSDAGRYASQAIELADGRAIDHTEPDSPCVVVPHRRNRAVLFDATTLHRTDHVDFDGADGYGHRVNLTLAYDWASSGVRR